ncbi:hypothetical protein V6B08_00485 [Ferrovibrio sp. MS7]|uniref:hypothetical protein n=1 Tax=Ferrovibrio plantarum TaxID=3119164 RepID=UPI003136B284
MSDAYIIEATSIYPRNDRGAYGRQADKVEAGLVRRERGGFRFFAAHGLFAAIENKLFRGPAEAERAAAELLTQARLQVAQQRREGDDRQDDSHAGSLVDPLALPPDWHGTASVMSLSFLPFDR